MSDKWAVFFAGVLVGAVLLTAIVAATSTHTVMYKRGQIDALSGVIRYEPQTQEKWVRIKDE